MKVCHIGCGWNPYPGGHAIRAVHLIQSLSFHSGVQNIVITATADARGHYTSASAPEIDAEAVVYRARGFLKMLYVSLRALLAHDVDVIHTHNVRMFLPLVLFKFWKPIVLEMHSLFPLSGWKQLGLGWALRLADQLIVLSDAARAYLAKNYKIPQEKITVIRNGVDMTKFSCGTSSPRQDGLCHVGYVGTFYRWQGVFDFVEAIPHVLQKSSKVRFHMVGQGQEFEAVRHRSQQLGLDGRIMFHGPIPFADMPGVLRGLDVVVIPRPSTLATETAVPLKVFEFMAAGKAIVASEVGGLLEVLHPGQDCLTYAAGSTLGLADAIARLAEDPGLRESLGRTAAQHAANVASWEDAADSLNRLYCEQLRQ